MQKIKLGVLFSPTDSFEQSLSNPFLFFSGDNPDHYLKGKNRNSDEIWHLDDNAMSKIENALYPKSEYPDLDFTMVRELHRKVGAKMQFDLEIYAMLPGEISMGKYKDFTILNFDDKPIANVEITTENGMVFTKANDNYLLDFIIKKVLMRKYQQSLNIFMFSEKGTLKIKQQDTIHYYEKMISHLKELLPSATLSEKDLIEMNIHKFEALLSVKKSY